MEQLEHEPAPIWDASIVGSGLTHNATMLTSAVLFSKLIVSYSTQALY